jgi:hypothetical protein
VFDSLPPGRGDRDEDDDKQAKRGEWRHEPDNDGAAGGELDQRPPPLIEAHCRNAERLNVRFVPKADIGGLFDHFLGGRKHRGGEADPAPRSRAPLSQARKMAELFPGLEIFDALRRQAVCEI